MVLFVFLGFYFSSCQTNSTEKTPLAPSNLTGSNLVDLYCGSCHLRPIPKDLPKHIWMNNVLPKMAYLLGVKEPFDELVSEQWKGSFTEKKDGKSYKKKINKIRPIFDYFTEELKDFDQKALSDFLSGIYKSYVVCIQINDPFEAFSIFERTNGRGIDLEASDLLKNYFFSKQVEGIEEIWTEIVENSDNHFAKVRSEGSLELKEGYLIETSQNTLN